MWIPGTAIHMTHLLGLYIFEIYTSVQIEDDMDISATSGTFFIFSLCRFSSIKIERADEIVNYSQLIEDMYTANGFSNLLTPSTSFYSL